ITIAIGLIIGVTASSMLVRHALDVKDEQAARKPGNYNSLQTAVGQVKFPPLPSSIKQAVPNGIVAFFEGNRTSLHSPEQDLVNSWVIETTGSFRSERLFILAEVEPQIEGETRFIRASEIYVKLKDTDEEELFESSLDQTKYRVIGMNASSQEHIVQVRNFSPSDLAQTQAYFNSLALVQSTRFPQWNPPR
ncbi:MAG: hypothetical protein VW907_09065, partial [Opitutae bacterium]